MFKRMGMTLGDLCVFSPALTGDYESSIALLQADAECAKVLASLEKSKRDMVIDCAPLVPNPPMIHTACLLPRSLITETSMRCGVWDTDANELRGALLPRVLKPGSEGCQIRANAALLVS